MLKNKLIHNYNNTYSHNYVCTGVCMYACMYVCMLTLQSDTRVCSYVYVLTKCMALDNSSYPKSLDCFCSNECCTTRINYDHMHSHRAWHDIQYFFSILTNIHTQVE